MAGLSGGFLAGDDLEVTLDEPCIRGKGSFLGAGGIIVFDDSRDMVRYVFSLLHLERKLIRQPEMLQDLRRGIETAAAQAEHFSSTHPNVISSLADLYSRTISTLSPRIMVKGEPTVLSNPENAARIRTLLLAGVRSTVLWRQCGGTRLNLLIQRRRLLQTAEELAASLTGRAE